MLTTHFRIAAEEIVAAYENSDNGSGPMVVLRFTDHREGWGTGFRQPAPSGQGYSTTLQHTLAIFLLWKGQVVARKCESEFRRARASPLGTTAGRSPVAFSESKQFHALTRG